MMNKLISILFEHIEYVTSGFSLLAFIIAAGVLVSKYTLDYRKSVLEKSKGKDKIDMIERLVDYFDIDTNNLTKDQKYMLVMEQIKIKRHRLNLNAFMFCFVSVIFAGVAAYTIRGNSTNNGKGNTVNIDNSDKNKITKDEGTQKVDAKSKTPYKSISDKVFAVPAGTLKHDVKVKGTWYTDDGRTYLNYTQNFQGFDFDSEVPFVNGVAQKAKLIMSVIYGDYRTDDNGKITGNTQGTFLTPLRHCFGDKYLEFKSNLIGVYGGEIGDPIVEKKDNTVGISNATQHCKYYEGPHCTKSSKIERRTSEFKDDDSDNILVFVAQLEEVKNGYSYNGLKEVFNFTICRWTLFFK